MQIWFSSLLLVFVLFVVVDDDKLLCIACRDGDHTNALCRRRNEIYNAENVIRILQDMNTKKYSFALKNS